MNRLAMNNQFIGAIKAPSLAAASVLGLALLTSAAPRLALAAGHIDWKVYPGSMCVKWGGTGVPVYNFGSIGNNSTTGTLYVDCPAVNEYSDATYLKEVRSSGGNPSISYVRCTFESIARATDGTIYRSWSQGYADNVGDPNRPVKSHLFGAVAGGPLSHYYYSCQIPPKNQQNHGKVSYLHTYRVQE